MRRRPAPSAQLLALYYDDPQTTAADLLRSDAALAFPDGDEVPAGLIERRVPAGHMRARCTSARTSIWAKAWTALKQEIAAAGCTPAAA